MIDTQARPASYMKLLALVVLLGLISAVITFVFMFLVHQGTSLVWEQAALALGLDQRLFTLLVCSIGGLLVGLLVKFFGDHSGIFAEVMQEFGRTGRFDYRNAPGIVVTAFVSLISGASLGPEAPLADACGGMGTLVSDRLKLNEEETRTMGFSGVSAMLAAFITSPFSGALLGLESAQSGPGGRKTYFWVLFPSLLASAVATVVFVWLSGTFFESLYVFPDYSPLIVDLFYAVPLGLIGGAVGLLFMVSLKILQKVFLPMKAHVVLRGLLGGVGMGIIGALLPLTLFSGEAGTSDLIAHAAEIGVLMLIVLSVTKLFATTLVLATGWKGGYVFPVMFASIALGLAANLLFPHIPVAVAVAATMAGALVATMRSPLFAALFTVTLVQREAGAVIAVAVVVSALLTALLTLYMARRAADQTETLPETE